MKRLLRDSIHRTKLLYVLAAACLLGAHVVAAQGDVSLVAQGFSSPIGLALDEAGNVWVAEQGTGEGDGRVSIVTPDGTVHPFLVGLPSEPIGDGEVGGTNHVYLGPDGRVWITQGEGTADLSASLLVVDPAGFTPGDDPLTVDDLDEVIDVGTFAMEQGAAESNPYTLAWGDDGDLFIVDAAANAVYRRDATDGSLSVLARFAPFDNPTGIGPPVSDAVPTGLVYAGDRLYVSTLVGFPFPAGVATIFEVDLEGNVSVYRDGLTSLVELDIDARDGNLLALQIARFDVAQGGFLPGTGILYKIRADAVDTVAAGLNLSSGMHYAGDGTIYVSSLFGQVLSIQAPVNTAREAGAAVPDAFTLHANYPNPFNPGTTITFDLARPAVVRLDVYDALGRHVRTLVDGLRSAGTHRATWDGRDAAGSAVASGTYVCRLQVEGRVQARTMVLLQ